MDGMKSLCWGDSGLRLHLEEISLLEAEVSLMSDDEVVVHPDPQVFGHPEKALGQFLVLLGG